MSQGFNRMARSHRSCPGSSRIRRARTQWVVFLAVMLSACTAGAPGADDANKIRQTLMRLNAAENQSLRLGIESKVAAIDATHAPDWEGWSNGNHSANREAERQNEVGLFQLLPDYHRTFDQLIVDPPFAAVLWTARGTSAINGADFFVQGSSVLEFDQAGKVMRSWVHFGNAPSPADLGVSGQ